VYDEPIDKVLEGMRTYGVEDPEFDKLLDQLERLTRMKAEKANKPISNDTLAIVAGNLMGILIMVAYEQKHVVTSNARQMFLKTR
jgi:CHASE3 domain sensor protein